MGYLDTEDWSGIMAERDKRLIVFAVSMVVFLFPGCIKINERIRFVETEFDRDVVDYRLAGTQIEAKKIAVDSHLALEISETSRCKRIEYSIVKLKKVTHKEAVEVNGYHPVAFEFGGGIILGGVGFGSFLYLHTDGERRFGGDTNNVLKMLSIGAMAASIIPFAIGVIDSMRLINKVEEGGTRSRKRREIVYACKRRKLRDDLISFRLKNTPTRKVRTDGSGVANIDLTDVTTDALRNNVPFGYLKVKKHKEIPISLTTNERYVLYEFLKNKNGSAINVEITKCKKKCEYLLKKAQLSTSTTMKEIAIAIKDLLDAKKICDAKRQNDIDERIVVLTGKLNAAKHIEMCRQALAQKKSPGKTFYKVSRHVQKLYGLRKRCRTEWKKKHNKTLRKYQKRADYLERRIRRYRTTQNSITKASGTCEAVCSYPRTVCVRSHYQSDGSFVPSHCRRPPRRRSYRYYPSYGYGGSGSVRVRGYRRKDGTYVRSHTRRRPRR